MAKDRISKVTTRAGDKGKTKTATGKTLPKYHPLIRAVGSVDELNSHIGLLLANLHGDDAVLEDASRNDVSSDARAIQQSLFDIGAVLTMEGEFDPPSLTAVEDRTQALNATLPPLTEFVLPGGGHAAAQSHVCRTVCRRAEADVWALLEDGESKNIEACARYLNRLSDYFFVLARALTEDAETQWVGPGSSKPE